MLYESEAKPGFVSRQFSDKVTSPQLVFDVIVGVIAPILCFKFDPIVFVGDFGGIPFNPELWRYRLLVYFFSGISILTLSLWLLLNERSGALNALIAGILFAGSACSLLIGFLILPLSVFGLLILIGAFGFIPFLTAFVYLRNATRAYETVEPLISQAKLRALLLLGGFLVIGSSVFVQWQANRIVAQSMNELLTGDRYAAESAAQKLRYLSWAVDLDNVVWTYGRETDQTRKDTLAKAYKEITGRDIEHRLAILRD